MRQEPRMPQKIYSNEDARKIDLAAIKKEGVNSYLLMHKAAEAALEYTIKQFSCTKNWKVICGGGNNAGDGFVFARLAAEKGLDVSVSALVLPENLKNDALQAYEDFIADNGKFGLWSGSIDPDVDLIIDAILGSGLSRKIKGSFSEAIDKINKHDAKVVSLDIPTGINSDTGAIIGNAIRADMTIIFVALTGSCYMGRGQNYYGEKKFDDLDIPRDCYNEVKPQIECISNEVITNALPIRQRDAHKGDFGHLLIVGGSPGMLGAVLLAGEAALRCGAGRVTIATHPSHCDSIPLTRPELMSCPIRTANDIDEILSDITTIVIGPGLGKSDWANEIFSKVITSSQPIVVDADGLNILAKKPNQRDDWILTPHPGEAARLLEDSTTNVQLDRLSSLKRLQKMYKGNIVLKGMGTLIASRDSIPLICTEGNPGMASPGMGDILAGIIGGLLAQGLSSSESAAIGVAIHAKSGDVAALIGERGTIATDLMDQIKFWANP